MKWLSMMMLICAVAMMGMAGCDNEPAPTPTPTPTPTPKTDVDPPSTDTAAKPVNADCPISGKPADPQYTVKHEKLIVGFCCENCPAKFTEDPGKYLAKLNLPEVKVPDIKVPDVKVPETPKIPETPKVPGS